MANRLTTNTVAERVEGRTAEFQRHAIALAFAGVTMRRSVDMM
jgi:hypothetical protein